ncbi:MAG: phosphatase PAP2 family protein [Reichenbachiella sp.]
MNGFYFGIEALQSIIEFRNEYLTGFLQFFTFLGEDEGYILIITFIYLLYDKKLAVRLAIMVLSTMSANHFLKMIIGNPRPFVTEGTFLKNWQISPEYANELATEFSTPSGHAMSSFVFYSYLQSVFKSNYIKVSFFLIIVFIGISRPYLGVHYIEDVVIGWLVGFQFMLLAFKYGDVISNIWTKMSLTKQLAITAGMSIALWMISFYITGGNIATQPLPFVGHLGFILGVVLGNYLERKHLNFDPKSKTWGIKILRWVIAIILVMTPLLLLEETSWIDWSTPAYSTHIYQYLCYATSGFLGIYVAPYLFIKFNWMDRCTT